MTKKRKAKKKVKKKRGCFINLIFIFLGLGLLVAGIFVIWISTLNLPDFTALTNRKIQSSTKIYDRTGKVLLYDLNRDIKKTVIPYQQIGTNIMNATVAIEDSDFYKHRGIRISSIIRATIWTKLTGKRVQGGSTITQQLVKNILLTSNRSVARKVKEWILAVKLETIMSKQKILTLYLNNLPYGGNIYGIDEASKAFFGVEPINLNITQAAYLASIPNAPSYYSPYGSHLKELRDRKNLVLQRELDLNFITKDQYDKAIKNKVTFLPKQPVNIAAPHFVFFVEKYLKQKYGKNALLSGGLKIITTLDYSLQEKVQKIVADQVKINEKRGGSNAAAVVIDPKTGQILAMVGSRNYFDKEIDGNFNVATALRQPGSSFKPIVYALAFKDGYTDKTTLFDVPTEFNSSCSPQGFPLSESAKDTKCYMPTNFNSKIRGPMTLRDALAQSINIVAVKLLYLVGVNNTLRLAHNLGITSLNDPSRYGLSLAIGGGETSLLDMTSAYSVFANDGIRNPYQSILSIQDSSGKTLEKYQTKSYRVLDPNVTRVLSSILSDNVARTPTFGPKSMLVIPEHQVAVKTGTTNKDKDAWTIGYTPSFVVGVWAGNNDDTPMKGGSVAMASPIWNAIMKYNLKKNPQKETFPNPDPIKPQLPPIIRGLWMGGDTFKIDKISGGLATQYTPKEDIKEISITNVHTILYWINKENPLGTKPTTITDPLYTNWEYGVANWWQKNKNNYPIITKANIPTYEDNVHTQASKPLFLITGINSNDVYREDKPIYITIKPKSENQIKKIDIYINNTYFTSLRNYPFKTSFIPQKIANISKINNLHIIGSDVLGNTGETTFNFTVMKN